MGWKFWRNDKSGHTELNATRSAKLGRPKALPQQIGQYLVLNEKMDPDWVWNLKCVLNARSDNKHAFDFRVFSMVDAASKGVAVKDYGTLETHPELILFHGWYNKTTNQIELYSGAPEKAA